MLIAKEILSMFEFSRNPKLALSVNDHFDECSLSQEKSVPTDRQTLSMHRYVLIESHCKASVAPWVHPFSDLENDLGQHVEKIPHWWYVPFSKISILFSWKLVLNIESP